MAKITVAVVGVRDGPEADAGSAILACLDRKRFERVALVAGHTESGAYRRDLVDRAFRVPDPWDAAFEKSLARLKLDVVLPGSRESVLPLARAAAALKAKVPLPAPQRCEKIEREGTGEPCRRFGLPRVAERLLGYPPDPTGAQFPATLIDGCGNRRRVADAHELVRTARGLRERGYFRIGVVHHDPASCFETCAVVGRDGVVLASASVRVLADDARERPWMTVTVDHPDLRSATARLAGALQLDGPVTASFSRIGGRFHVLDARPGLPLWIESCTLAGPNLVEVLVDYARGAAVTPKGHVAPGVVFSQTADDVLIDPADALRLVHQETP